MADISIIIISFNTRDVTERCIETLLSSLKSSPAIRYQIIVVDNNSTDGSAEMLAKLPVEPIFLKKNLGFGKANNLGLKQAKGKYVLFLNSDVIHDSVDYADLLAYMDTHSNVGSLTLKLLLPSGAIDPASHRGFPTLWRAFTYYGKLERLFGGIPVLNRLFGGYHLTHEPLDRTHDIDACSGAYFLTRRALMEELGGFDEQFFMYGEDLDLSYRIAERGFRNIYYPKHRATHLKYQSGIKTKDERISKDIRRHFYRSMAIFYRKHYERLHPRVVNALVYRIISGMEARV
jgi:GT2 family glycosyltransferase